MKNLLLIAATSLVVFNVNAACLYEKIAANATNVVRETWYGYERIKFDFEGHKAWVVEPKVEAAAGMPWTWVMQWAEAYVDRQGCLDLLALGWHHVTIDVFAERMTEDGLKICRDYQRFLVEKLGFAPKANLIGMSWGGFFSVRYTNAYPDCVRRIYLDAPLLTFHNFANPDYGRIGPWAKMSPTDGNWLDDPRMPVNMAKSLAAAGIPILLLYGGQDQTVPPDVNCELFARRFRAAGGNIKVDRRNLYGHHPHGEDPNKTGSIVQFFTAP